MASAARIVSARSLADEIAILTGVPARGRPCARIVTISAVRTASARLQAETIAIRTVGLARDRQCGKIVMGSGVQIVSARPPADQIATLTGVPAQDRPCGKAAISARIDGVRVRKIARLTQRDALNRGRASGKTATANPSAREFARPGRKVPAPMRRMTSAVKTMVQPRPLPGIDLRARPMALLASNDGGMRKVQPD